MARRPSPAGAEAAHPSEESWFAALGVSQDTQIDDEAAGGRGRSRPSGWRAAESQDSRFLTRQARRLLGATTQPSFQRIYRAFLGARVAVGLLLLGAQAASHLIGAGSPGPSWVLAASAAYALATLVAWWLGRHAAEGRQGRPVHRLRRGQWLSTVGLDVAAFGLLHLFGSTGNINYLPLLVLPVLMAGVLTSRGAALSVAAAITLLLLGDAWWRAADGNFSMLYMQAGLVGSGFFVIALLAGELASRLAREELAARGSMELARQQAQLNRLVIEEMQDGVLVVDRRGRVRVANPAARRLLAEEGLVPAPPFQLHGDPAWQPLAAVVMQSFKSGSSPETGLEVHLPFPSGHSRGLRVRLRFTKRRQPQASEELCVLFLEDLRDVQARTRQEKLAAMGRISAGIAHEIRNPLSAIAQANALLAEDLTTPAQRQLSQMVADNVERLKRIVDDVMEVAPGGPPVQVQPVDVTALVASTCSEWARTARLPLDERSALRVDLPLAPVGAAFDPDHLRRVLINLLDNGYRHASKRPGSVEVRLVAEPEVLTLSVCSDGPPIPPDVERYLFEPFFSTRSRGTGLGLYICKELCERYGATIDYRLRSAQYTARNEFYLVMRVVPLGPQDVPSASLNLTR
ncbi:HAMP domain-containing histidine kinase [Caldimonas thermodepolymerans]|uniref:histidine kinase n=1 Tax=Caldimonas thermodepolymerans TaxID=215580 RepID=A0A2S5T3G7_9BURK|nr:HAMP domain-containing sensor histidine kinase [Caldimonas thermodepolymerans]PPE69534.1 histidine kinase [Caldimonas thermodepolymerans]QPC30950.1 HAMP domain-containing histidine kinase [Caldimonas thermodepolymerans]RDH97036.1 two-component system sensor histidine kinase PilS (NtrC family) [Caldimonas thermodepolymerans]